MRYPNTINLEFVLDCITFDPGFAKYGERSALSWVPLAKLKDANPALQLFLEDQLGEFTQPSRENIHAYWQIERLPRLAEGTFDVPVPAHKELSLGELIEIPETILPVQHSRTYHPSASFDEGIWMREIGERSVVDYESDNPGSEIKRLVNIELITRDVSSVYSEFRIVSPSPPGWHEAVEIFEDFFYKNIKDYQESRRKKTKKLIDQGKTPKAISGEINKDDDKFLNEHGQHIFPFANKRTMVLSQIRRALENLIREYQCLVSFTPLILEYERPTYIVIDSEGRGLDHANLGNTRPIFSFDIANSGTRIERPPFNDTFHNELRENLRKQQPNQKPHEAKANFLLYDAFNLIKDRHYSAALTKAQTAFEVALKGFLSERGVYEERLPLRHYLRRVFDLAVQKDPDYSGRRSRIFDATLFKKIVGSGNDRNSQPTIQEIRNNEVHLGGSPELHSRTVDIAWVGCSTYAEAVSYIINQGWKKKQKVNSISDVATWISAHSNKYVPRVPQERVIHMLESSLDRVKPFLDQRELARIQRDTPKYSWAHGKV